MITATPAQSTTETQERKPGRGRPPKAAVSGDVQSATPKEKEVKAPAPAKVEETPEEVIVSDDIKALVASTKDAVEAAFKLNNEGQENFFRLGGVLSFILKSRSYKETGATSFEDYCEGKVDKKYKQFVLGILPAKAFRLVKIYDFFTLAGVSAEKLSEIGWTKAHEIARINGLDRKQIRGLLKDAKTLTVTELSDKIHNEFVSAKGSSEEGTTVKRVTRKFRLYEGDASVVASAIELCQKDTSTDDESVALAHICSDWLQLKGGTPVSVKEAISALEARYGIKVTEYKKADSGKEDHKKEAGISTKPSAPVAAVLVEEDDSAKEEEFDDLGDLSDDDFDDLDTGDDVESDAPESDSDESLDDDLDDFDDLGDTTDVVDDEDDFD